MRQVPCPSCSRKQISKTQYPSNTESSREESVCIQTWASAASTTAPLLGEFVQQHPLIQMDLELSALPLNISGTNFDIAIRVGGLSDSRLKAKLLARNRRIVCAAPDYVEQRRSAARPSRDLEQHNCIVLRENNSDYCAVGRFGEKEHEYVEVRRQHDQR